MSSHFYKNAAGKELPKHTHKCHEFTLIMEGGHSDKSGDYRVGDFVLADNTTIHQPKGHQETDCICLAVMDGPLKMTGLLGKVLNPFLI